MSECIFVSSSIVIWGGGRLDTLAPPNDTLGCRFLAVEIVMNRALLAFFMVLVNPSETGAADSSQCGFIRDADQRAYCRATSGEGESQCGFIRDHDLRALCRAEASGKASQCGFIRDSDRRALCRAKARQ
jgi:hypothetical protein